MWSGGRSTRKLLPHHVLDCYCAQYDSLHIKFQSVRLIHGACKGASKLMVTRCHAGSEVSLEIYLPYLSIM